MKTSVSTSRFSSFGQFLEEYASLRSSQSEFRATAFAACFSQFQKEQEAIRLTRTPTTPHLNILNLLDVQVDELTDSRILSWLFSDNGEHEQGDFFLNSFLTFLGVPLRVKSPYQVLRERSFAAPENSSTLATRVDIIACSVVKDPRYRFAVFIENKVFAGEQTDQFDRTVEALVRFSEQHAIPKSNCVAVFATLKGDAPSTLSRTHEECVVIPNCSKQGFVDHLLLSPTPDRAFSPLLEGLLRSYQLNLNELIP